MYQGSLLLLAFAFLPPAWAPGTGIDITVFGACAVPSGIGGLVLRLSQSHLRPRVLVNNTRITIRPARGDAWTARWSDLPTMAPGDRRAAAALKAQVMPARFNRPTSRDAVIALIIQVARHPGERGRLASPEGIGALKKWTGRI